MHFVASRPCSEVILSLLDPISQKRLRSDPCLGDRHSRFDANVRLSEKKWAVTIIQTTHLIDPHSQLVIECITTIGKVTILADFQGEQKDLGILSMQNRTISCGIAKCRIPSKPIEYFQNSEILVLSCCKVRNLLKSIFNEANDPVHFPTVYDAYGRIVKFDIDFWNLRLIAPVEKISWVTWNIPIIQEIYKKDKDFVMGLKMCLDRTRLKNIELPEYNPFTIPNNKILWDIADVVENNEKIKELFQSFERTEVLDDKLLKFRKFVWEESFIIIRMMCFSETPNYTPQFKKRVFLIYYLMQAKIYNWEIMPLNCHTWIWMHLKTDCQVLQDMSGFGFLPYSETFSTMLESADQCVEVKVPPRVIR